MLSVLAQRLHLTTPVFPDKPYRDGDEQGEGKPGNQHHAPIDELYDVVFGEYRPNQVVVDTPVQEQELPIPLFGDRPQIGSKATA